jgi:hypothetical protein
MTNEKPTGVDETGRVVFASAPEVFTLDDFVTAKYQELPQYADCPGIDVDLVRSLHESGEGFESAGTLDQDHLWFVHRKGDFDFWLYVYAVNTWTGDNSVRTVDPFVLMHGTTFDGVRACWFSNTEPSDLPGMAAALTAADAELRRRGWVLV